MKCPKCGFNTLKEYVARGSMASIIAWLRSGKLLMCKNCGYKEFYDESRQGNP